MSEIININIPKKLLETINKIREKADKNTLTLAELSFLQVYNFAFSGSRENKITQAIINELAERIEDLNQPSYKIIIEMGN